MCFFQRAVSWLLASGEKIWNLSIFNVDERCFQSQDHSLKMNLILQENGLNDLSDCFDRSFCGPAMFHSQLWDNFLWLSCRLGMHTSIWHTPTHDDIIKWKHFPCYWSFLQGIHRSSVNSPQKGQWHRQLLCFCFVFISGWTNGSINNPDASDDISAMLLEWGCHESVVKELCSMHGACGTTEIIPLIF